jgi:hypothetical protein
MNIHRGTFYDQKEHYPDTYKKVQEIFENSALNSHQASDTIKIFYLKKKFKEYSDNITVNFDEPLNVNINMDNLTVDELKALKTLTEKAEAK